MLRRVLLCTPFVVAGAFACGGLLDTTPNPPPANDAGTTTTPVTPPVPVTPPSPPEPPPLLPTTQPVVIDLGAVPTDTDVTFVVPPNALGFNIVLDSSVPVSPPEGLGIARITSPSGEVVHDAFTPAGGDSPTSQSYFGTIVAASVPQSQSKSANTPEAGTWKVRFASPAEGASTLHAEVRIQVSGRGGFTGGRLDLRVYVPPGIYVDGKKITAASAAGDPGIISRLGSFFGAAKDHFDIDRGDVTFHEAAKELGAITNDALLVQGFSASSRPANEQSMQLLLTNAIDFGNGDAAWGIAPGIPGGAGRFSTSISGIILAVGETPAEADGLAILHEMGHFVGLNHTTEFEGGFADPLTDTPSCPSLSLDDPSTINKCPDRFNLMFPTLIGDSSALENVSPAQVAVFHGSPVYKAYSLAMQRTKAARPARVRPTLTRSGRALRPIELWLSSSLCGHVKADPVALARRLGKAQVLAALRAAATDTDLPDLMKKKAAWAVRTLEQAP